MSQFRSEEMNYIQLFIQNDAAHDTLHELGAVGAVQFKDLNTEKSAFQKMFVQDVRKCEDMLRIIRYLKESLDKEKMPERYSDAEPVSSLNQLHERLQDLEKEMKEHSTSYKQLLDQRRELTEHLQVLRNASKWFGQANRAGISMTAPSAPDEGVRVEMMSPLLDEAEGQTRRPPSMLGHIAGCIPTTNVHEFAVTLFRATRGNMHLKHEELNQAGPDETMKSVFIVYFSGERSRSKIDKICEAFAATRYSLPDSTGAQEQTEREVQERLSDLDVVVKRTEAYQRGKLSGISGSVDAWRDRVEREKGVCHTLNKFNYDVTHKCLIAEGWAAASSLDDVRAALRRGTLKAGASVQTVLTVLKTKESPPTYFKSSKVTAGFQAIVDAYGMARYQEFNPAVFTFITFPFLFGVMFGDIGHGFIMALTGGLICLFEKKLQAAAANDMFGTIYEGRYNILMMGIFATYSGFIYNELFSVPLEVLGSTAWCSGEMSDPSCLDIPGTTPHNSTMQKWLRTNINEAYNFQTQQSTGVEVSWDVFPMGQDPGWSHTANKLNSANSFKMKFAIVVGVVQMVAGVCCKLMNCLYFKDMITLYFVYIPEMVFINSIFGYLVILILVKWTTNWDATYILNNSEVVHIPQVYCLDDLSNKPCWTAPFHADRSTLPIYAAELDKLPARMWCMAKGVGTAGCAVFEWQGKVIVEGNGYGNNSYSDASLFNAEACSNSIDGCMLYKQSPPSLLDTLIKMFMEPGHVPIDNQLIPGQGGLQAFLILIAFVSVPMLLLPKPLLLKAKHQKAKRGSFHPVEEMPLTADDDSAGRRESDAGQHGEEFDFSEEMVHQMIHTIEYVLGCISNTASYLRLWALSLAHAQLSEVFWEKTVVEIGLESGNTALLFVCITAWSCFTFGVLMGMESLSAFLHALRLHWVEFMNKFYHGDGYKFTPFTFGKYVDNDD